MNELQIFKNEEFGEIRTTEINGEFWFVGKDVCNVFADTNHNRSLSRIDEEDKQQTEMIDSMGRNQKITIINESGLYSLLFQMQPQKAHNNGVSDEYPIEIQERINKLKKFKRWVTSEVLPSIRKNGLYATDQLLDNPDFAIEILQKLKQEREEKQQLQIDNKIKSQQIAELKPKADYTDRILQSKGTVIVSAIAKDYGMSGTAFNKLLKSLKVQYRQGEIWLLYTKYQNKGYTHSHTFDYIDKEGLPQTRMQTQWTQKGRLFLYELLKKNGVLPMIERSIPA